MANPTHPTCSLAPLWPHASCPLARPRAFQHKFSVPGLFHFPAGVLLPNKLPQNTQPCCLSTPSAKAAFFPSSTMPPPGDCEPTVPEGQGHAAKPGSLPIPFIAHICPQIHTRTHTHTHTHTHTRRWAHTACFSLPSSLDTSLFIWILLPNEFSLVVELE